VGWTNTSIGEIIATKVIIEGDNGELFVYQGPPTAGNLLLAISANGGTDPYGNVYSPVIDISGELVIDSAGDILGFNTAGSTTFALVQSEYMAIYADDGAVQGAPLFAFSDDTFADPFGNTFYAGLFIGAPGTPAGNPVAGMILYVNGAGNLLARTQDGNTRTIASV
jgi:hypothetical protein